VPIWSEYWGMPWGGFGWIFPVIGLVFMVVMAFMSFRMMGRCMTGHGPRPTGEVDDLRREVQGLRAEIRELRDRG
jgi:uncharacterized membrane protein